MLNEIKYFYRVNKFKLLVLTLIYALVTYVLASTNYPYIDDISRQATGVADFAWSYSRYFSEYGSFFINANSHILDLGITTQLIAGLVLAAASSIVLYAISKFKYHELDWSTVIAAIFIGLNPWFLECLSFRFDSPFMAFSVFFSVLPFLFWEEWLQFVIVSVVSIFLMFNSYQGSSGIYIVMALTLVLLEFIHENNYLKDILYFLLMSAISYLAALLLYFIETLFNPSLSDRGDTTSIAKFSEMPSAIIKNFNDYISTVWSQTATSWKVLGIGILLLGIMMMVINLKRYAKGTAIAIPIYFFLALFMSYGMYLAFSSPLAHLRPRYAFGFGFFFAIIIILISQIETPSIVKYVRHGIIYLLMFYIVSFDLAYSSILTSQEQTFREETLLFYSDLNDYISEDTKEIKINQLFDNSVLYDSAVQNYTILEKLVPNNQELYWPNVLWFNKLTHQNLELTWYDPQHIDFELMDNLVENTEYSIYDYNGELYILMKDHS